MLYDVFLCPAVTAKYDIAGANTAVPVVPYMKFA